MQFTGTRVGAEGAKGASVALVSSIIILFSAALTLAGLG